MDVLQRKMFQMPQTNEPMGGITSGLDEAEAVESTEALGGIASGIETLFQNIDNAENPKEIMDAIRGDEASVEERRTELGQLVGKADADKTPESVLTIVQPLMTVIESTGGIASLDTEESPVAQNIGEDKQMEAMARMQSGEIPVMRRDGSTDAEQGNPAGNLSQRDMLQMLLQKQGVYGANDPIRGIQMAQKLIPTPKRSDYTGLFTDKPSAYGDYAETLPFLQLAKFGQILGRSPTVMSAVTSPETTALADPLLKLSMLKAKEKSDRESKEATAFSEAKKTAQAQRADLYKPLITQMGTPNTKTFKADDGSEVFVNMKTGATATLAPGAPEVKFFEGLGLATIQPDGNFTINQADIQVLEGPDGRKVAFNPVTQTMGQELIKGQTKLEKIGSDKFGYYSFDPVKGTTMKLLDGEIPLSDAQKLIKDFADNRAILKSTTATPMEKDTATTNLEALRPKIFGEDTEFLKVVGEMTDNFRNSMSEDDLDQQEVADVDQSVRDYKQALLERYFDAKTISQQKFDPRKAEKEVFLDILKKKIMRTDEGLENVTKMGDLATQAKTLSQNFKTGLFAPTRLTLGKILDAFPPMKAYMQQNTDPELYKEFFGGGIASGEALKSVSTQFALAFAQFLPGNLNTEEINMIQTAAPGLTNTKEGIELLTKMFAKQSERLQKQKAYEDKILDATKLQGKELYTYHSKMMRKFKRDNPILTKEEAKIVGDAGRNLAPATVFRRQNGQSVGLPATDINVKLHSIGSTLGVDQNTKELDFATFQAKALPRIKDILAKDYKDKLGQIGDIDAYLDPNTDMGKQRIQRLFNIAKLKVFRKRQ